MVSSGFCFGICFVNNIPTEKSFYYRNQLYIQGRSTEESPPLFSHFIAETSFYCSGCKFRSMRTHYILCQTSTARCDTKASTTDRWWLGPTFSDLWQTKRWNHRSPMTDCYSNRFIPFEWTLIYCRRASLSEISRTVSGIRNSNTTAVVPRIKFWKRSRIARKRARWMVYRSKLPGAKVPWIRSCLGSHTEKMPTWNKRPFHCWLFLQIVFINLAALHNWNKIRIAIFCPLSWIGICDIWRCSPICRTSNSQCPCCWFLPTSFSYRTPTVCISPRFLSSARLRRCWCAAQIWTHPCRRDFPLVWVALHFRFALIRIRSPLATFWEKTLSTPRWSTQ